MANTFKVMAAPTETKSLSNIRVSEKVHKKIKELADQNGLTIAEISKQMIEYAIKSIEEN